MKREDKIIEYLEMHQKCTTSEIAEALGLQRSNVSKILNDLVRLKKVEKTKTRPVCYSLLSNNDNLEIEKKSLKKIEKTKSNKLDNSFVFEKIIGYQGSMKTQIEQAKASILYPPKGLNCLITGQTGTGKTLFVHTMFQFAKDHDVVGEEANLTVFNCADYAHNADLLMAHLFGYVKGAFTGAEETTDGLIQQADGGMLFLDEVHRLTPEGQEMIFYFMDHGKYARLGEVEKQHHANVRIVCATTEDPNSNLLSTFMRRIPITIQLPNFYERPAEEQVDLLRTMLQLEATRVNKKFLLTEDVAKSLLGSVTYGNVGQLKSNVQLVCARGFLHHMDQEVIRLTLDMLTPQIKEGLVKLSENKDLKAKLAPFLEYEQLIVPQKELNILEEDAYELPYNIYEIIGDKAAALRDDGVSPKEIYKFITTDINVHLKTFYQKKGKSVENNLADIVDHEIISITNSMKQFLEGEDYPVNKHFLYAMSLHLSSFMKREQAGEQLADVSSNLMAMVNEYPKELEITGKLKQFLEEKYSIQVPLSEFYYLATLLISLKTTNYKINKIGVVVVAHGNSTASSMVSVVTQLLNVDHLRAFDMPLDMNPSDAIEGIKKKVKEVDHGHGVLLLADMGSLVTIGPKITKDLDVQIKTLDMVTTAMVLEAARKTSLGSDLSLEETYQELRSFKGYSRIVSRNTSPGIKKAILTICATGSGTAKRLQEQVRQLISNTNIEVLPISVLEMDELIPKIEENYQIIATIGLKKPKIDVPFLTIEHFLSKEGKLLLKQLVLDEVDNTEILDTDIIDLLNESFTFINARKILPLLQQYFDYCLEHWKTGLSSQLRLNLIVHLAGMIERILRNNTLTIDKSEKEAMFVNPNYEIVQTANQNLAEQLNIVIPDAEVYYILGLLDTQSD